ncbi:unnamed protein product, partial [Fusarium langsethiae]
GTEEPQGPSAGFRTMNSRIMSQVPGDKVYNTVYAAGFDQNSAQGTRDIVREVNSVLASNPSECIILEGYSQGAAATVNAMSQLTGSAFDAVKGVFLIGDPLHRRGLECNVDNRGGSTTKDVSGISAFGRAGIPQNWVSRTLDVCVFVSPPYYNTSLLRPVGQRPKGSEANDTYISLVIALLSSSPYDSRLVPSSPAIALLLGPPWC